MSQRGKRKAAVEEEELDDECSRLRQVAQDQNICSKKRRVCSQEAALPKHLASADGKDILKKSTTRKGRYLFHISARLTPAVGGKLGTLANLDSKNPVMYVDFPSGRLKLIGTLLFPKAKYLLLKFGSKDVLCEDVFESVVLFAEMHWVGTKDANPSEAPLELPAELQQPFARESAAGEAKAADGTPARKRRSPPSEPASQPATQWASQRSRAASEPRSAQKAAAKRRAAAARDSSEGDSDADDDAEVADPPLSQRQHLGRSCKAAAQRRLLEVGSDDDAEQEAASSGGSGGSIAGTVEGPAAESEDEGARQGSLQPLPQASQATPAPQRVGGRKRAAPVQLDSSDKDELPPKRQRKPAAARGGRAARKVISDSDEASEESAQEEAPAKRHRKPAAAHGGGGRAARKNFVSDSDGESAESIEDEEDEEFVL